MSRTRVKICGITRAEDAISASELGVDALGLVFYDKSPRNVSAGLAQSICVQLPAFVSTVGLFLNPEKALVQQVLAEVDLDVLQFHGTESAAFCASFGKPYIKALGVGEGAEKIEALLKQYADARSVLLDSHRKGEAGGTGESFDWASIPQGLRRKIILAGGLNVDNVARAIQQVRPWAVDLSSGVESLPGIKDNDLMNRLMQQVRQVDCE
ncbi:MAG TPA: phosphoribosylanthranilate isomerase [Gammaproteobacteria bacterium]|nr:phosphoribosylanthranilate isomerase [Gammaproteobacteria bacterium]